MRTVAMDNGCTLQLYYHNGSIRTSLLSWWERNPYQRPDELMSLTSQIYISSSFSVASLASTLPCVSAARYAVHTPYPFHLQHAQGKAQETLYVYENSEFSQAIERPRSWLALRAIFNHSDCTERLNFRAIVFIHDPEPQARDLIDGLDKESHCVRSIRSQWVVRHNLPMPNEIVLVISDKVSQM